MSVELVVFGVVALACLTLGFFMYRSMKATGGCGCCSHLNNHEHHEHCDCGHDHEHDHEHCSCENEK